MNSYASPGQHYSPNFEKMMGTVEEQFRQAVAYMDKVIVPQIRKETGGGLRLLAGQLERLADKIDPQGKSRP